MQYKWLNRQNNKKLIVFFNGWGMAENIVQHLDCSCFDVLVLFDYRTFDFVNIDFSFYEEKNLIAWSMGVYVCSRFYEKFKDFNRFIAINGTQKPIDDNYGIPVMIYNLTVENFNELSCSKFMKKISSDIDLKNYCSRSLEALKEELIEIRDLKIKNRLKFDKAIISKKDRIFPYKNMRKFWNEESADIVELDAPHSIFDLFQNWSDLL